MQSPVTHHRPLISVVFAMLLVMLALPAQTSLFSEYSSARLDNVSALTFDEFGHSDSTINEHRAPVTSLSPDLASLLRSGSWLPEKLETASRNTNLSSSLLTSIAINDTRALQPFSVTGKTGREARPTPHTELAAGRIPTCSTATSARLRLNTIPTLLRF